MLGTATALDNPTRQAFIKEMVGPEDVPNAIALNSIVMNTARLTGPALAGLTIAAVGVTACFALNAVSFLAVIGALLLMRPERFYEAPTPQRGRMLAQIGEGLRYAMRTPEIAPILLLAVVFGIFGYNFNIILPLLARYVLHAGPVGFGALSSAMAVGSLVGAFRMAYSGVAIATDAVRRGGGIQRAALLRGPLDDLADDGARAGRARGVQHHLLHDGDQPRAA